MAQTGTLTFGDVALRLLLAVVFGGIVGLEREHRRRPAGFRTYMLVCLGSAAAALLGQYEYFLCAGRWVGLSARLGGTDSSRFAAQVINGMGFLGAGTIIITSQRQLRGVTTASALWATACMGLALGVGFLSCACVGFVYILLTVKALPSVEHRLVRNTRHMEFHVECETPHRLAEITENLRRQGVTVLHVEQGDAVSAGHPNASVSVLLPRRQEHRRLISAIARMEGVCFVQEV